MILESVVILAGLCLTFLPPIIYLNYLLTRVSKGTKFDSHLDLVRDKKGIYGVIVAYSERIMFGTFISSMGILMSEFFDNELFLMIFVVSLVVYIIVKYLDNLNEKQDG